MMSRLLSRIQNRLVIAFLTVTTLPLVALAILITRSHLAAIEQQATQAAADRTLLRARRIQDFLLTAQTDILYLSQVPTLESLVESRTAGGADEAFWHDKTGKQLETFAARKAVYSNVAYVEPDGRELLRVTRDGSSARIVGGSELRNWAGKPVFVQGMSMLAGQTRVQLSNSGPSSTAIYTARVLPRSGSGGLLLLELPLANLWALAGGRDDPQLDVALLDRQGRAMYGEASTDDVELAAHVASGQAGRWIDEQQRIVTFLPLYPSQADPSEAWYFVGRGSREEALVAVASHRTIFIAFLCVALALAAGLSVVLARQLTRPITYLRDAARQIGGGHFDVPLENTTGDEIGELAEGLERMAAELKDSHENLERQVEQKTRELVEAQRLSQIGRIAAGIAHEINNPIGIISMYSQMLLERLPPDDRMTDRVRLIEQKASQISGIVQALLQLARKGPMRPTDVDLAAVLRDVLAAAMVPAPRKPIDVREQISPDLPHVQADATQLATLFGNLVRNAVQAMPEGGQLALEATRDGDARVCVRIADTGTGIRPEDLPHLFEPFYTTRPYGSGTGLGLALAREIVDRHGGTLRAETAVGRGTTFIVTLPVRLPAEAGGEDAGDQAA